MDNTLNSCSTKSFGGPAAAHVRDGTDEELIVDSHLTMSGMYSRAITGVNKIPTEGGGPSICKHWRRRSQCKECRGSSICEHGRQRSQCKECGGASVCEYGRRALKCKKTNGDKPSTRVTAQWVPYSANIEILNSTVYPVI